MCGITGFVGAGGESDLKRMTDTLRHRGPDDRGVYCKEGVGLGHTRLSIIDLTSSGHQPMWNKEESVGIIFNGEIYNFLELKKNLVEGGRRFVSTSDTEVILALYERDGEQCFAALEGMFAIVLYDRKAKKLILARDRMGKKPLYYGIWNGSFVFGSEPKALLAHPLVKKEIDLVALNAYFALDYVPTPLAIWKGMKKLEPGTFLVYKDSEGGKIREEKFWMPDFTESVTALPDALRTLDCELNRAVATRLVSDVPLGVFLSGGLDSSAVAYYAARAKRMEGSQIHTFSIGFSEADFDESQYAQQVATHLNTIHHHKTLSGKDSLDIIPEILLTLDEPMADASIIPTYLLSRFTKEHVTVALGGDGGDELFAGYPTFQGERMMGLYHLFPKALRQGLFLPLAQKIPPTFRNFSTEFKLKKFFEGAEEKGIVGRHMCWLGTFDETARSQLLTPDVWRDLKKENAYRSADAYFGQSDATDERNKLLWLYQRTYMMDQVLVKVDRASMRASLETRAPFLDRRVVEFANRLPYTYKLNGMKTKYLLKKLMAGKLPENIIHRKKHGFGVPVGPWLQRELRPWAEELLSERASRRDVFVDLRYPQALLAAHLSGKADNRKKLWNILVFLEWQKRYL